MGTKPRGRARKRWVRLAISVTVLLLFLPHCLGWMRWGVLTQVENFLYDARLRLTMPATPDPRIVIVDIDERSLAVEGQWPWHRDKVALLLDRLFDQYGVRAAGFDVVFAEADKITVLMQSLMQELQAGRTVADPALAQLQHGIGERQPDQVLARALAGRSTVLGMFFKESLQAGENAETAALPPAAEIEGQPDSRRLLRPQGYTGNLAPLQQAAAAGGFFDNPLIDGDGSMRRVPLLQYYNGRYYEALGLAMARVALGPGESRIRLAPLPGEAGGYLLRLGSVQLRLDAQTGMLVPYRGYQGSFPYVSASEVLAGRAPIDTLFDSIVLIGTTAPGLLDLRTTPVGHAYGGVEVHANVVSALLDGRFKYRPGHDWLLELAALLLIGLLFAWLLPVLPGWAGVALVAVVIFGSLLASLLFWILADQVVPMASPVLYSLLVILLQITYSYVVESRNKRRLSRLFGQYVPPEIVEEMNQTEQEISLRGSSREMSVLFSDVQGFTRIAEQMPPAELTELMNAFLTPITRCIHQQRGTVDKYMGDAVMAFWAAPMPDPAHATHAVAAALAMQQTLAALAPEFQSRGWPRIGIGIGINTGVMQVGNMGSEFRMAYTVLGDAVNLGARLEALTRQYGVGIIVSEFTRDAAAGYAYRELDRVQVKGKDQPVGIFEVLGRPDELDDPLRDELFRHEQALGFYRLQNWAAAEQAFRSLAQAHPDRALYRLYLERIAHFRRQPPPPGWDGVFRFEFK